MNQKKRSTSRSAEPHAGSRMINFRVKSGYVPAIDAAAQVAGVDRSTFIRTWVEKGVMATQGGPQIVLANGPIGPAVKKPVDKPEEQKPVKVSDCAHTNTTKTTWGIKICQECGAKIA